MTKPNPSKDTFSARNIGTGKFFTAGRISGKPTGSRRLGLAGALRKFSRKGRFSYADNLSKKDLETFHGLIGKEMAGLTKYSKGLGRQARMRIMTQAEKLVREGKISMADKKDLRGIVKALSAGSAAQKIKPDRISGPRQRAVNFITDKNVTPTNNRIELQQARAATARQRHIKGHIKMDIANELIEEERQEALNLSDKSDVSDSKNKHGLRGEKVELSKPKTTNLSDMPIDFGD